MVEIHDCVKSFNSLCCERNYLVSTNRLKFNPSKPQLNVQTNYNIAAQPFPVTLSSWMHPQMWTYFQLYAGFAPLAPSSIRGFRIISGLIISPKHRSN